MRYAVVIEPAGQNYSAYVPDLLGCVATGATVAGVEREIRAVVGLELGGADGSGGGHGSTLVTGHMI
jgi:predicted RNase H-like HicB family nuclease